MGKTDEEIKSAMLDIFPNWTRAKELGRDVPSNMGNIDEAKIEIRRDSGSIYVKVTQMYDAPEHGFGLAEFVQKMTEAVGLPEMEECGEIAWGGCETCDYGSCYGTEFRFWDPQVTA